MFFLSIDPNFLLLVEQLDVSPLLSPGFLLFFFFSFSSFSKALLTLGEGKHVLPLLPPKLEGNQKSRKTKFILAVTETEKISDFIKNFCLERNTDG